jgi:cytochrome c-type biogenesis protein CcmH/NrfF
MFLFILIAQQSINLMNPFVWFFPWAALIIGGCYFYVDLARNQHRKNGKKTSGG